MPVAAPAPARTIDHWNERASRGANHVAEGELVEVGPSTFRPLAFGIPGYRFTGGTATAHAGVELLVEGGGPVPQADVLAKLTSLIDAAPSRAVGELAQVKVEARQDEGYDHYYERAYRIPGFQAVAASGPGQSTYFGGRIYFDGAFFHELGHVAGDLVDSWAWNKAIKADDANIAALLQRGTLAPTQLGPVVPDPVRRERWTPRLQPGGITGYGESALKAGTNVEDLSESLRLRTSERYFGSVMATFHDNATGADRPISFAELYPNRAHQLETLGPAVADLARHPN